MPTPDVLGLRPARVAPPKSLAPLAQGGAQKLSRPSSDGHDSPMLGDVAKRAVNVVVVLLAAMAFFLVPFGRRTLYQHVRAVFSTPQADELKHEIEKKATDVKREVVAPDPAPSVAPHRAGH